MCVVFVFEGFADFYMEANQLSKEEFELIKKLGENLGISPKNEVVQIISWHNGKLFDDDYNKYADIAYSVHRLGLNFKSQFYLNCRTMKNLPWQCKKHEHTTISLNTNDKKDIEIQMSKGQTVDEFLALSVYAREQKPVQWDAKMVTIESKEDNLFDVSYKKIGEDCFYH